MGEPPLDLRAVEARLQDDLRSPVTGRAEHRPLGYGEVETILRDGRALLAALRASVRLLQHAPVPRGYSWRQGRDAFLAQVRDEP